MSAQGRRILAEVLDLPPVERAELVEEVLSSFDFPERREIDRAWAGEAEDRLDAYDRGELKARPVTDIFEALRHASR